MHCKCLQSVEVGHDTDKEDEQQHLAKQHRHEFFAETATTHINQLPLIPDIAAT